MVSEIIEQREIHEMVHNEDVDERREGIGQLLDQLCWNCVVFPNDFLGWNDLIQLVQDEDRCVREDAAMALMIVSHDVSNKEQAWQDLTRLTQDEDSNVRTLSTKAIGNIFHGLSDKEQAWKDLHSLSIVNDIHVRAGTAYAIVSAYHDIPNKKQAWDDLIRLAWDKEYDVRSSVPFALMLGGNNNGSFFSSVPDKVAAWNDLIKIIKHNDIIMQNNIANAIFHIFPNISDKNVAWKDMVSLVKDKNNFFRLSASIALGSSFPYILDKELAYKDLISLTKDKNKDVRMVSAHTFSHLARFYRDEHTYKKTSEYFDKAASAFRFGFCEHFTPTSDFYLYKGLSSYYFAKELVSELPDINDPERYIKNLQNAIGYFKKSVKFIKKSNNIEYETDKFCFPICLNIFSAYYEYILCLINLDEKRISKVQNYLKEASKLCEIVDTEKGLHIIKIFIELSQTLKDCIDEINIESKKQKAIKKGKGKGLKVRYETSLNNSRYNFEKHFAEINNLLNEIEAPLFIKIAEIETENLKKLQPEKEERDILPKSFIKRFYESIKEFWKIIATIGLILAILAKIINDWDVVSEFIINLLS